VSDERFDRDLARLQRLSVRPGAIGHYYRQSMVADVGDILPSIKAPTLLLNRTGNRIVAVDHTREVASLIPDARFVELPGTDHLVFSEDVDAVIDEIEEFVTGARTGADPDRLLATLLFTDIVDSTRRASELGDRRWRELIEGHDSLTRRQLERFRGREVKTLGDGFLATFDGPARAVECACAIREGVRPLGIEVRAGVHTGECEFTANDVAGMAVNIGARVGAIAGAGEVVVSSTVKDLTVGADLAFSDRGEHELKGIPGTWRLYSVEA
jgi:class 3 adenylate cyclase